ncbi:LytTR family DNA-binding domain-containing protein [Prolixibacteraceae bacterium Z1-6]|uniref:LytTR family DNA-binding domain-containing protein n=1 Tax=Draconibacterium aestuarii TaxID=2998507 RepID=A0A9X3F647_9BACT|nr:LytTR family DNA-binding domain-containing protein [Prolixibacteraceae bacterium Z1-6]
MNIVIIEDEKLAADKLQLLLHQIDSQIEVLAVLESVEDAVNWLASNPSPDLIFMDIQLDDGISFEIFEAVKIDSPVIFTTAFDEYAIRAFKVNSVDYLLKPVETKVLELALQKFKTIYAEKISFEERVSQVFEQISKQYKSRFFIKIGTRYQSVQVPQVCSFFVEERNTFLQTIEGKTYDLDYSLDQLQKMVNPEKFFRINRNFLVNINCIDEIISYSSSRLKLKLKSESCGDLIVSRDKVSEFKRWMDR